MTRKVKRICEMADTVETLADFGKRFKTVECLPYMIAVKTIAGLKHLDGFGYYTCVMNGKKIFVVE